AGYSANGIWYKDLTSSQGHFIPLFTDFKNSYEILDVQDNQLLVLTNADAPNKRLLLVDITQPSQDHWKELIPEKKELLEWAQAAGGKLFISYLKDAASQLCQYDMQGNFEKVIPIPAFNTINGFEGNKEDDTLFYSVVSFTCPTVIYKYIISTGQI